jgi:DNA polymerase III epsilon subunit family exonuclease
MTSFTFFDLETTGLSPQNCKVVEIAGVRIENGVVQESQTFSQLIYPECVIPPDVQRINNISNEDVAGQPTIDEVLPGFLEFSEGSILVAHNASFDMGFLEVEKQHCWGYIDLPECLCTLRMSRALYPGFPRHTLGTLGQQFNIEVDGTLHRALPDVLLGAKVLVHMMNEHSLTSLDDIRSVAALRAKV